MGDVEFEPLHGDIEDEEEAGFVVGGRKRDTPGKRHKQKSAQLFPRKSVEKKDKTVVFDNSKAISASPMSTKSGHSQHHHHQRNVEGLVGPGDIQFGSSPPNYSEEDVLQNNLSQSTGNIPISINQSKQMQKPTQLPVRPQQPPAWSQVSQPTTAKQQPRTPSQEKPTLLEQSNFVVGSAQKSPVVATFSTPDKFEERLNFQTQPQKSPPRLASPTESKTNQMPMISPSGRRFQRSESWGPSSHSDHTTREENWADFSKTSDGGFSADDVEVESQRRRHSQVSTISEGSEGSYISEVDEGVWKITEEQRTYYVNQFKKLQPNDKGLIKGPQARDFFMKSNLPVEVLSKIWHLSDVNKDSALDIEEFCIAMHLVVAVKHDVELPPVLPTMLAPKPSAQAAQGFTTSFPTSSNDQPEEERPQSPKGRTTQPDEQSWASFDVDGKPNQEVCGDEAMFQKTEEAAQSEESDNSQGRPPPDSSVDSQTKQPNAVDNNDFKEEKSSGHSLNEKSRQVFMTPSKPDAKQHVAVDGNTQSPAANTQGSAVKEFFSRKTSIEIARPRGIGPAINLMDSAPGQLLPPPDSRKIRKMAQQAQPEAAGSISPPLSPDSRFSSDFSSNLEVVANNADDAQKLANIKDEEESAKNTNADVNMRKSDQAVEKFDSNDGFEPPKLLPRSALKLSDVKTENPTEAPQGTNGEVAEVFIRRSSSVRRGERPRSYTADSRSSMESLVDALPHGDQKELSIPPTPPPRKTKSHKRGSSLDLNKIFGARAQQNMAEIKEKIDDQAKFQTTRLARIDSKEEKRENKERGDIQGIARPRPSAKHHGRSTSHELTTSLTPLAPPPKTGDGILKDAPTTGYRKKPAPPPPHPAARSIRSKSLEKTIEMTKVEEPLADERKSKQLRRPSRQKRQRHEIKAEIRLLQEKNASIASLNSELHQELKEAMDNRTQLERKLAKTKQSFD